MTLVAKGLLKSWSRLVLKTSLKMQPVASTAVIIECIKDIEILSKLLYFLSFNGSISQYYRVDKIEVIYNIDLESK